MSDITPPGASGPEIRDAISSSQPPRHGGKSMFDRCESLACRARGIVARLNTVHVAGVGLATGLGSTAVVALAPVARAYVDAHCGHIAAPAIDAWISAASSAAIAALPPAVMAAWAGKPIKKL